MSEEQVQTRAAPHVYVAMHAVMSGLAKVGISKEGVNKEQGFKFRSIDQIYQTMTPLLVENHLLMIPYGHEADQVTHATKSGAAKFVTRVTVDYVFVSAIDGSQHTARIFGEGMDMADKSTNKAMSASYKYGAILSFGIPLHGETDADADDASEPAIAGTAQRPAAAAPARGAPVEDEPGAPQEQARKFRGTRAETAKDVVIDPKRKAELIVIGKSFIDLVDQERAEIDVDNRYKIWELAEPLQHDELLWLSVYLDKHTKVLTRIKAVMVEEREKIRHALAANNRKQPPIDMPDNV